MATKTVKKVKKVITKKAVKAVGKKAVVKKVVKAIKVAVKTPVKRAKVEAKIAVSKPAKAVNLTVSVFDVKGKTAGQVTLPQEIFGAKINESLMSQAVRVYLANQRQGTSKTKGRGEVDRTTKKIYQQKGTGRARHGSRRAPIFVGGGRVFGPTPRDLSLNITKKMKTLALFSALSSKLKDNEIKIVKGLEMLGPKTKLMAQALKDLGIKIGSRVLLVMPKGGAESVSIYRSARNIRGVEVLSANSLSAYKVLDNALVILMRDSVDILKNIFVEHKK